MSKRFDPVRIGAEKAATARALRLLAQLNAVRVAESLGVSKAHLYNAGDVAQPLFRLGPDRLRQFAALLRFMAAQMHDAAAALEDAAATAHPIRRKRPEQPE